MPQSLWILLLYIVLLSNTTGHNPDRKLEKYLEARTSYQQGNYQKALASTKTLEPILDTSLKPYALFYQALSLHKLHNNQDSIQTLEKLIKLFPSWEHLSETLYWLGYLNLLADSPKQALKHLNQIKDKELKTLVYDLKKHFLLNSLEANDDIDKNNLNILKQLDKKHKKRKKHLKKLKTTFKDTYDVAVLLPFCLENISYKQENNYITDFYTGIKAAQDTLQATGIKINLTTYDTKKNVETTQNILPQLSNTDVIIGPLYEGPIEATKQFVKDNHINMFNPLSTNHDITQDNPFTFLLQPTLQTQAIAAAEYTIKHMTDHEKIGIVYSNNAADSISAHTYRNYIKDVANTDAQLMMNFSEQELNKFLFNFQENLELKQTYKAYDTLYDKFVGIDYLYLASKKDELCVNNILAVLDRLKTNPQVIGDYRWLNFKLLDKNQLARYRTILIAPQHIDKTKASLYDFKVAYIDKFHTIPTYYAHVGYELMLFIGRMLYQHGTYFQKNWEPYTGEIFSTIDYNSTHQDNQNVPIITASEIL